MLPQLRWCTFISRAYPNAEASLGSVSVPLSSAILSSTQLATLAEHGEERTAEAGEALFAVGDRRYPLVAIIEGDASVVDINGDEVVRHGPSGFIGEMNMLTGQTTYLGAVATSPLRYIAVEREEVRRLLAEDGSLANLLLATFIRRREILQETHGAGFEIVGPTSSSETRDTLEWVRRARLPHTWLDPEVDEDARALIEELDAAQVPLVRLPGGLELHQPTNGELSRALGIGAELAALEEVDLLILGGGPAGLGAAVYGASEGLDTLVIESTVLGGQAGLSRRIENYLGFPAGITGSELTSRAVTQARKFGARTATPYRAVALEPGEERHRVRLDGGQEVLAGAVVLATGAEYRRLRSPASRSTRD